LFIIIITIILLSNNSLGKYFSKIRLESENDIIEPVIIIENDETININSIDKKIYNFKIKNYNNEEKISKLDIEYYIKIIVSENIFIKVYKNKQEIKLKNVTTDRFLLSKNLKQEDNYKIEIFFFDNTVQEILDEVKMKIYYEQKNL